VKANFAPGLHVPSGQAANVSAYDRWVGRWSRLFVPAVISAAEVMPGSRVLDVSTGTGEAALMALPAVGPSGVVIGADIAPAMLEGARDRLKRDFGIDPLLRGDVLGRNGRVGWFADLGPRSSGILGQALRSGGSLLFVCCFDLVQPGLHHLYFQLV
jgi:SAM-dependent methyltransferase